MSDFHQYIVSDLQLSLEAAQRDREALQHRVTALEAELALARVLARYGGAPDLLEMHLDMVELLRERDRLLAALEDAKNPPRRD